MSNLIRGAVVAAVAATLALAPSAFASGGVNSGGGKPAPAPAPASGSCATISAFSNTDGYYKVWAAIWTNFVIDDACGRPVDWRMTYTNGNTGVVDFSAGTSTAYESSGVVDEDWAGFLTPYTVSLTVTDPATGAVLDSQSAVVTTKKGKGGGSGA